MSYRHVVRNLSTDREWGQSAAIALATATLVGNRKLMGTAMAVIVGRRGTAFAVSMVTASYFFGKMFLAPLWGTLADVTGRRWLILVGTSLLGFLAALPLVVVGGTWPLIGFRTLYAVFTAGFVPVMLTVVSVRGGEGGRGRSVGFFNTTDAIGRTVAQLAAGALLGLLVPSSLFLVVAGIALVTTIVVAFVNDPTPTPNRWPGARELFDEVRGRLFPAAGERGHLRVKGLRWLYVGLALRHMTVLGVMSLMPVFLTQTVEVSEVTMGTLLAVNSGGQAVSMYAFGRVTDEWGRKPLIVVGMAGSGVFAVIAAVADVPAAIGWRIAIATLSFLVIAATYSALRTGAIAFIGDVAADERESELMGLLSMAKGVGGVIGPPVLGGVATVVGFQSAFVGGSVLAFAATGLVWFALTESRQTTES